VVSPTTIIIFKVGEAIRIKILGGNKIIVHPINKVSSNKQGPLPTTTTTQLSFSS